MNSTFFRYFDYMFDIQTLDVIVLGAWTVIFFLIGALLMWLWLHYRWYKGIAYQKRENATNAMFRTRKLHRLAKENK